MDGRTLPGHAAQAVRIEQPDLASLPSFNSDTSAAMTKSIDERNLRLEHLEQEVRAFEKENAKAAGAELQKRATTIARELLDQHQSETAVVAEVADADGALLQSVADALKTEFKGPIFLAGKTDSRVDLIATVPSNLTSKFQAGALMQQIAPIVGGKGGGRPENARGAGNDATGLSEALARARELLSS